MRLNLRLVPVVQLSLSTFNCMRADKGYPQWRREWTINLAAIQWQ
jgi:hypothetical protein